MDWEAELAVVGGAGPRRVSDQDGRPERSRGFTVLNDVTVRDWQYRTPEWPQGKTFEATTPLGPWWVMAAKASRKDCCRCRAGCEPRHLITSKASCKGLRPGRTGRGERPGSVESIEEGPIR